MFINQFYNVSLDELIDFYIEIQEIKEAINKTSEDVEKKSTGQMPGEKISNPS